MLTTPEVNSEATARVPNPQSAPSIPRTEIVVP